MEHTSKSHKSRKTSSQEPGSPESSVVAGQAPPLGLAIVPQESAPTPQQGEEIQAVPKELPPDGTIAVIAQAVVSSMKLSGLLDSSAQPAASQVGQDVVLRAGQSIRIVAG